MIAPLANTVPESRTGRPFWIKLISPRMSKRPMDSEWKTRMSPPLALLTLAALTPEHHRVTLEDENLERPRPAERPDLVGLTVKADTFQRACEISAGYRARGIPVVWGGIHPTACPEACALYADAVVMGEAESTWPQIVRDAQAGALRPRYQAPAAPDLSAVPVPRWSLIHGKDYLFTNTLYAGRGCRECQGTGYRGRSGVFEFMPVTEDMKALIVQRALGSEIRRMAAHAGMTSLRTSAWKLAIEGVTSVDDVMRVTRRQD